MPMCIASFYYAHNRKHNHSYSKVSFILVASKFLSIQYDQIQRYKQPCGTSYKLIIFTLSENAESLELIPITGM